MYATQVSTLVEVVSSSIAFVFMFAFSLLGTMHVNVIGTCGGNLKAGIRAGKAGEPSVVVKLFPLRV